MKVLFIYHTDIPPVKQTVIILFQCGSIRSRSFAQALSVYEQLLEDTPGDENVAIVTSISCIDTPNTSETSWLPTGLDIVIHFCNMLYYIQGKGVAV